MAYAPTPNTIVGNLMPHLDIVTMRTTALMPLEKDTIFYKLFSPDTMQQGTGQICRWYRPNNLSDPGSNPTASTEGAVGTSKTYSTKTIDVKMANYSDYITISSQVTDVSAVNDLMNAAGRLGYYMALVYDNVLRGILDAEYAGMARTPLNSTTRYMSLRDVRAARHSLRNLGVQGLSNFNGNYGMIASPLVTYDYYADPDTGGLADLVKQQQSAANLLLNYGKKSYENPLNSNNQTEILESNNVRTGTDSNSNTTYYTYMLGDGGFGKVELSTRPTNAKPSSDEGTRFRITTVKDDKPSKVDPTGAIGGFCSANAWIGGACLAGPANTGDTYRGYQWYFLSSIA